MGKKRYSLTVQGRHHTWAFDVSVDPKHVAGWRADGLVIDELINTVPEWVVSWFGLAGIRVWCFVQDVVNFKNPWSKS